MHLTTVLPAWDKPCNIKKKCVHERGGGKPPRFMIVRTKGIKLSGQLGLPFIIGNNGSNQLALSLFLLLWEKIMHLEYNS